MLTLPYEAGESPVVTCRGLTTLSNGGVAPLRGCTQYALSGAQAGDEEPGFQVTEDIGRGASGTPSQS